MVEKGRVKFPLPEGIALAAVLGRHGQDQPPSLSFTTGYPIREGAIASTVSHDSHNLVIIGRHPDDLLAAARSLEVMGGGLVLVNQGNLLASLPLPIAGLLNPLPLQEIAALEATLKTALQSLGLSSGATATLLFMTLPVLPRIRLTDHGLVDVLAQQIIPLEVD